MSRKSILVVDDEKSQREILEMILSGEGYDVTTASSGEAALRIARERRFDLALTDVAFAARLRREPELRAAVETWLAGTELSALDWEQRKHERLLAA